MSSTFRSLWYRLRSSAWVFGLVLISGVGLIIFAMSIIPEHWSFVKSPTIIRNSMDLPEMDLNSDIHIAEMGAVEGEKTPLNLKDKPTKEETPPETPLNKQTAKMKVSQGVPQNKKGKNQSSSSSMQRLVHLDLKGAPPKVTYLQELFPLFKKWGATGLLIEYEDMFPYSGNLKILSAPDAYTVDNINTILKAAKDNGLTVIPLVQTLGHMEFVLKHVQYKNLQEMKGSSTTIKPLTTESLKVIHAMIKQMMKLHPGVSHIHLGADEAVNLGKSPESKNYMEKLKVGRDRLFIRHIESLSSFVNKTYNTKVKSIIWDDMMRNIRVAQLKGSKLGKLVEPMVWAYTPNVKAHVSTTVWGKYKQVFPRIWVASAFKGATGPDKIVTNISYHLENHKDWLKTTDTLQGSFSEIEGIILTGWQRYNHFSKLCELLPVGLPSLALNMQVLVQGNYDEQLLSKVSKLLNCKKSLELKLDNSEYNPQCSFPGVSLYNATSELHRITLLIDDIEKKIPSSKTNSNITKSLTEEVDSLEMAYNSIEQVFHTQLNRFYFNKTVTEFMDTVVTVQKNRINDIHKKLIVT